MVPVTGIFGPRLSRVTCYHFFMRPNLPLNEMTLAEKLETIEALWEDISRDENALESPEWHAAVLQEREKLIQSGEARFIDWEEAKKELRKEMP